MYAAIRQFKAKPGRADELAQKAKGAVPIISGVPGFMGYYVVYAGDDIPSSTYVDILSTVPAMRASVVDLAGSETPAAVASAVEFVLEGLHLSKRLNKDAVGTKATYRGRG